MTRIVVVSDSHLSPRAPHADTQWAAVVDEVRRNPPALVVHTGDVTLDGANHPDELHQARRLLDELPARWLAIPGNHDIGDIGNIGDGGDSVTEGRLAEYRRAFGETSWCVDLDGWRMVGIDIQVLASTVAEADDAWAFLEGALERPQPTALFLHRPLAPHAVDEFDEERRYVPEPARSRIASLLGQGDVRLVVSGHVHQWRVARQGRRRHVWAPSTWACLPDIVQPRIGAKVTGIVDIDLDACRARLVRPIGVCNLVIGHHFPSPYEHPSVEDD